MSEQRHDARPQWLVDAAGAGVLVLCAVAGLFLMLDLRRSAMERGAASDEIVELTAELERVDDALRSDREELQALLERQEATPVLAGGESANRRLAEIADLAHDTGVVIDQLRVGTVEAGPVCDVLPISFSGRGAFPDCARVLSTVLARYPEISARRVELMLVSHDEAENTSMQLELSWHVAQTVSAAEERSLDP